MFIIYPFFVDNLDINHRACWETCMICVKIADDVYLSTLVYILLNCCVIIYYKLYFCLINNNCSFWKGEKHTDINMLLILTCVLVYINLMTSSCLGNLWRVSFVRD